ncbi:MAG: YiiX/YebB-like N1pC/P60 family cysteine hydrolase [Bacteroidota bacterium]
MRRKRGLLKLFQDCEIHAAEKERLKSVQSYNEEDTEAVSLPPSELHSPMAQGHTVENGFYDHNKTISLSFADTDYDDYDEEEQVFSAEQSQEDSLTGALDYFVEPFEDTFDPQPVHSFSEEGQVHSTPPSSVHSDHDIEEAIVIKASPPSPPPVTPEASREQPIYSEEKQEVTKIEDDQASFEADLRAILSGQKKYDADKKQTVSTDELAEEESERMQAKKKKEAAKQNDHSIFEKIAQSMQLANTYDLGSINLEQRFDAFDQEMEKANQKREKQDAISRTKLPENVAKSVPELSQQTAVDTADFLMDLDKMSQPNSLVSAFSNDIPLSPKSGGRSIGKAALEVGDIILSTTADPNISGTIRKVTRSEVSHASVYVGNGNVIEAIESGVLQRSLETAMSDDTVTVAFRHQNMDAKKGEMIKNFLIKKQKEGTQFDQFAIVRNLPIQIVTSACSVFSPALRDKCRNFAGRIFLGTESNDEFYCSELVFAAYEAAGLKLTNTSPQWTSPEDLVQLNYNGTLRYVGHLKTT